MTKQLVRMRLADITPYENNPRHNDNAVEAVKESIKQCEYIAPIIVDEDSVILAGHTRAKALAELGKTDADVMVVSGLTDEQKRKYRLLDNKTNELASWDIDKLEIELEDIDFEGFDFGFDVEIVEDTDSIEDDDYDVALPEEPKAKLGDLYQLGDHRLICGDSTDPAVIERLMGGEKADMVFTDPPWNVAYGEFKKNPMRYKKRTILNDSMTTEAFKEFMSNSFAIMGEATKAGAMAYVVMSAQERGNLMLALADNNWHWSSTIIWNKDRLVLSRKDYHTKYEPIWYGWKDDAPRLHPLKDRKQCDVWDFDRPMRSEEHPTMKPIPLVARAVTNSSKKGDIVLDQFGGSGTTLIACEQTGRKCCMSELDPKYVDVIINRWEEYTGGKAVLINE